MYKSILSQKTSTYFGFNDSFFYILTSLILAGQIALAATSVDCSDLTVEHQVENVEQIKGWLLGCSGILWERNNNGFETLAGAPIIAKNIESMKETLAYWWGINNTADLYDSLEWIHDGGHSQGFVADAYRVAQFSEDEFREFYNQCKESDPDKLYDYYIARKYYRQIGATSLIGWDYCRYICLCRWGYMCGYIDELTAWKLMIPAGQRLQKTFNSWQHMGRNYLIGREYWSSNQTKKDGQLCENAFMRLCEMPSSPWNRYPWNLDLSRAEELIEQNIKQRQISKQPKTKEISPMIKEPVMNFEQPQIVRHTMRDLQSDGTIHIVPDQYSTIQDALKVAGNGDTVFIRAGDYEETVYLEGKENIKIVGESRDTVQVFVSKLDAKYVFQFHKCRHIVLSDLTIHFKHNRTDGKISVGVSISESDVDILRCDISNTGFGGGICYYSASKGTVDSSIIHNCQANGVLASGADVSATVKNCSVCDTGRDSLAASDGGALNVEKTEVINVRSSGILAVGKNTKLTCSDSRVKTAGHGINISNAAHGQVTNSTFSENKKVGIYVRHQDTKAVFKNVQASRNGMHGIYITEKANVELRAGNQNLLNVFSNNGYNGICLTKNSQATITSCLIHNNLQCGIRLTGGVNTMIENCIIKDNNNRGLDVGYESTNIILRDCYLNSNGKDGAAFSTKSTGLVENCTLNSNTAIGLNIFGLSDVIVGNSKMIDNGDDGIAIQSSIVELVDNTSCDNGRCGIDINGNRVSGVFRNNVFSRNATFGMHIHDKSCITASCNVCDDNEQDGIYVNSSASKVFLIGNHCRNNHPTGICYNNGSSGCLRENICEHNDWAGLAICGKDTRPVLCGNSCTDNGAWGITVWHNATPGWSEANTTKNNGRMGIMIR